MKVFLTIVFYTSASLALLLINDYIFVTMGQPSDYWSDDFIETFLVFIFATGYFGIFFNSLQIQNKVVKFWVSSLLALISIAIFVFGSFIVLMNFHTFIGGTL